MMRNRNRNTNHGSETMDEQEKGVLDRAARRADRCRKDAKAFREAGERMRGYAYFGDEYGDAAEDPEAVQCYEAFGKAAGIATAAANKIEAQMERLPGHTEWVGDPVAKLLDS